MKKIKIKIIRLYLANDLLYITCGILNVNRRQKVCFLGFDIARFLMRLRW